MDTATEIKMKADAYAKRLLHRQREQNMSSENREKGRERRISIMHALQTSYPMSLSNLRYTSNPFAKEFGKDNCGDIVEEFEKSESKDLDPPQKEEKKRSLSPGEYFGDKCDDKAPSNLFNMINPLSKESSNGNGGGVSEHEDDTKRFSLGEYFGGKRDYKESIQPNFASDPFEEEFLHNEREIKSKGADAFFAAHVLEIIEPDVMMIEHERAKNAGFSDADITFTEELNKKQEMRANEADSIMSSYVVSDIKDRESETRESELAHPQGAAAKKRRVAELSKKIEEAPMMVDETPKMIEETPKKLYPDLSSMKRMSDKFTSNLEKTDTTFIEETLKEDQTPENLDDSTTTSCIVRDIWGLEGEIEELELEDTESAARSLNNIAESPLKIAEMPEMPKPHLSTSIGKTNRETPNVVIEAKETEIFSTPNFLPGSQTNVIYAYEQQNYHNDESATTSFLKPKTNFFKNLHLPKMMRWKSNRESTQKNEKTVSPHAHGEGATKSALVLPKASSSPVAMDKATNKEKNQHQAQFQMNTEAQCSSMETAIPREVEKLSGLALGDEQNNTSIKNENPDLIVGAIDVSGLIPEDRNPIKQTTRVPMAETPKYSSTLNRTLSRCKTFTWRKKQKDREAIKDEPKPREDIILIPDNIDPKLEERIKDLLKEVETQQTLISLTRKALELGKTTNAVVSSLERIKSERTLMIAQLHHKAYLDEIRRLMAQRSDDSRYCERGQITIGEISVELREDVQRRDYQSGHFIEWFLLVISEGTTVWATDAIPCPISDQTMYFPGQVSIPDLRPDFMINVRIYSMRTSNAGDRQSSSATWLSPKRWLKRSEKKTSPKQHEITWLKMKDSSFALCASVDLIWHDLNLKSPWPLSGVPENSVLHGTIDLDLTRKIQLSVTHAGFVTHSDGVSGSTSWNRRWCVLKDRSLHFWNYPDEQESTPPLYSVNLDCSVSKHIGLIDRSLCPRARTLLIEIMPKPNDGNEIDVYVERRSIIHLLSCDTNEELTQWQSKLNHVVTALREWHVI